MLRVDQIREALVVPNNVELVVQRDEGAGVGPADLPTAAEMDQRRFQPELPELGAVAGGIKDPVAVAGIEGAVGHEPMSGVRDRRRRR